MTGDFRRIVWTIAHLPASACTTSAPGSKSPLGRGGGGGAARIGVLSSFPVVGVRLCALAFRAPWPPRRERRRLLAHVGVKRPARVRQVDDAQARRAAHACRGAFSSAPPAVPYFNERSGSRDRRVTDLLFGVQSVRICSAAECVPARGSRGTPGLFPVPGNQGMA